MPTEFDQKIRRVTGRQPYPESVCTRDGVSWFMAGRADAKRVGCVGCGELPDSEKVGDIDGAEVLLGPLSPANAAAVRKALPWTGPRRLGLAASIGMGDRLGLATPAHIQAVRGSGLAPVLAQQSMREMARTHRTPQQVIDAATWGVLQEGYNNVWGADADHLQKTEDIDATVAAGFVMFTIDPGQHVDNEADSCDATELDRRFNELDFDAMGITPGELRLAYASKPFELTGGGQITLDEPTLMRAAVKYGRAVVHTAAMYNHLKKVATRPFELEISVDETETPTTPAEHYYFAAELKRLGVEWVSLAPRFVGRFEKGVDYIGDLEQFQKSFVEHAAVMRTLGPYKISIHSGSDKFSIYSIAAKLTNGLVHLKTAGTSYLEALRAIARIDPKLLREIYTFSRDRYETDKATYHVSAELSRTPPPEELSDAALADLLEDFDARQVLHVTFGSVLTADEGGLFGDPIRKALESDEKAHYQTVERHLRRHVEPLSTVVE